MRPGCGIDIAERMEFYRRVYKSGIYSLEMLINIYDDYELHKDGWINSIDQRQNFLDGQTALAAVIKEIKEGVCVR